MLNIPPPPARVPVECDTECFPNWWLIKFRYSDGSIRSFQFWEGGRLDVEGIKQVLMTTTIYTFNGNNYDVPMILLALTGASCRALKHMNDTIIPGKGHKGPPAWQLLQTYGLEIPTWLDHVDLKEIPKGVLSLKMYGGRMHSRKLQESPVDFSTWLTPEESREEEDYCENDLATTLDMRIGLAEQLHHREVTGKRYGIDLRSKSDAQMAEAIVKSLLPFKVRIPPWPHGTRFSYTAPGFIHYVTPQLQNLLYLVKSTQFVVSEKITNPAYIADPDADVPGDGILIPPEIEGLDIVIGQSTYRIGIGGLHSQEKSVAHFSIPGVQTLSDHDVKSYYPSLWLLMGMSPRQIGPALLDIYRDIYHKRLEAKAQLKKLVEGTPEYAEAKAIAEGFKITLNGLYGKLNSKYSIVYAPDMLIAITVTGQLSILMLIERLELGGVRVISANTDGIVLATPAGLEWYRDNTISWWERTTGLETEAQEYKALYSRDVNCYVAIKPDGKVKGKSAFAQTGIIEGLNPDKDICGEAVCKYLAENIPMEFTIRSCRDVRKFLSIRQVDGGGRFAMGKAHDPKARKAERVATLKSAGAVQLDKTMWHLNGVTLEEQKLYKSLCKPRDPVYLGKAVRWYHSVDVGAIYTSRGGLVGGSTGARPMMELPADYAVPADIDYQHYIDEAYSLLAAVGVKTPSRAKLGAV